MRDVEQCDLFVTGRIRTMDPDRPQAGAMAVTHGRIVAIGERADLSAWEEGAAEHLELGTASVFPGFVEAHGHPLMEAVGLSGRMVDIRPVTLPDAKDVLAAITREVAARGMDGAYLNGWDPLLQKGLPLPTRAWLDAIAPDTPLVIVHNSGHSAYFNSAKADQAGLGRQTPDPAGARFGRDANGDLDGSAYESAAVMSLAGPVASIDLAAALPAECRRLNAAGVTTSSEMAFSPMQRRAVETFASGGGLTVRLRLYEMSGPQLTASVEPGTGDDLVRQIGIKTWADGSPWIGNIATSFDYLDTPETRSIGLSAHHRGHANFTAEQLASIGEAYFPAGWQLSCHVHGDVAVDMVLDVWTDLLERHPRPDHRLRIEHAGAMTPAQFRRAADLGVTCSFLIDHLYYWGDALVDGLFGPERGEIWSAAGSALEAGLRISLHNDPPVTPEEPLRNITVAVTRTSRSGRVLAPQECITVDQALRAQTIDAAWQLFAEDVIGSLEVGKYADLVVLAEDPYLVEPAQIAEIEILATYLAGTEVYHR
ncbi:amidohydrolase [Nakamurella silvestris]|nr:amidohydrolase [Nakamurella silvestris]